MKKKYSSREFTNLEIKGIDLTEEEEQRILELVRDMRRKRSRSGEKRLLFEITFKKRKKGKLKYDGEKLL